MKNTKRVFLYTFLFIFSISFGQLELSDSKSKEITAYIEKTIEEIGIPGGAVAIIKDNKIIYKNYFGKSNLEYNTPVTDSSLFRLHSLSKVFVSVAVFQLIEQNKISLDDKISNYLTDLPDDWKDVKIKNLLSHSSGLPDMREEPNPSEEIALKNVYSKPIQFPIGERSNYNQTNFWLLNRIIRKITKGSFQNYISNQFKEDPNVCFSNSSDIISNRVTEYKPDNKGNLKNYHFLVQEYLYGAAGLTMTLDNLIDWDKKLNKNMLINEALKNEMFTKFKYKVGTGFSYGWDVQNLNNVVSYGFNGGGLVNYRKFLSKNISIIWLTNGYKKPHNIDNITNRIVAFVDRDLKDKTPEFAKLVKELITLNKPKKAIKEYHKIKNNYPYVNIEKVLNAVGYDLMNKKKTTNAITLFKLNSEEFSTSANVFDSLGEGYFMNKQYNLALVNYKKVLEIEKTNENAKKMIKKITTILKNK